MEEGHNGRYQRVIPRDLFNESKLLKCLGRLSLLVHEGKIPFPIEIEHTDSHKGFEIKQTIDGDIYVSNLYITINGRGVTLFTPLNNTGVYPLMTEDLDWVFNEDGTFSNAFIRSY